MKKFTESEIEHVCGLMEEWTLKGLIRENLNLNVIIKNLKVEIERYKKNIKLDAAISKANKNAYEIYKSRNLTKRKR